MRHTRTTHWVQALTPLSLIAFQIPACSCSGKQTSPVTAAASPSVSPAPIVALADRTDPLPLPAVGDHALTVVSPRVLELLLVTTKEKDKPLERWDFASNLPAASALEVRVNGVKVEVSEVGFKRHPLYAPIARWDLRLGNYLYLKLATPIPEGAKVEVNNPDGALWPTSTKFESAADPARTSSAIHISQVGYIPGRAKVGYVGYYLGTLGEMSPVEHGKFSLVDTRTNKPVFTGDLKMRKDRGFTYGVQPYQQVQEADFSSFNTPGEYRLTVAGLGSSFPFRIDEAVAGVLARTYALGMYHQRCGTSNDLPFTRFVHGPCHTAPAEVPTPEYASVQKRLAEEVEFKQPHQLTDLSKSLYPFVNKGKVDVSGGHHDAGDYGKYTFNSAQFLHELVFAADAFPGVGELDNLGIPESGDGKSDVLQIAKWEADFLAKMQDADGGFYYLVQPKERKYEYDVPPEKGDTQVVFPKSTVSTGAAVAVLAQIGSSPRFKKEFPADADRYLEVAKKGWAFLQKAEAKNGREGAYERIGHYGDKSQDADEVTWAATEMYLATGDPEIHSKLLKIFDPSDPKTIFWTWIRLNDSYGGAIRSYAFAAKTGRMEASKLDKTHLAKCIEQIQLRGQDLVGWASDNAYGTSFGNPSKRFRAAGWYFSGGNGFDLVTAYLIQPKPEIMRAIMTNFAFEAGANPNNMSFLTGVGWQRQREIVSQYAHTTRRVLPPTGIPLASVQAEFSWTPVYGTELRKLTFPSNEGENPFPFYDRFADTYNVNTEFTVDALGRGFGPAAFLMGQSSLKNQPWKSVAAKIDIVPMADSPGGISARLIVKGVDLATAQVVWEVDGRQPQFGTTELKIPSAATVHWVEAEAMLPDGRRLFAVLNR